jgi:UDP-glucuronate decarboxylase
MQCKPDITLAARELAWKPTVALEAELRRTIDYFRNLQR